MSEYNQNIHTNVFADQALSTKKYMVRNKRDFANIPADYTGCVCIDLDADCGLKIVGPLHYQLEIQGRSTVVLENCTAIARGGATIHAFGNSRVLSYGCEGIYAWNQSFVHISCYSTPTVVYLEECSRGYIEGLAIACIRDQAQAIIAGTCSAMASGYADVICEDSATIVWRSSGQCLLKDHSLLERDCLEGLITARDYATVLAGDNLSNIKCGGDVSIFSRGQHKSPPSDAWHLWEGLKTFLVYLPLEDSENKPADVLYDKYVHVFPTYESCRREHPCQRIGFAICASEAVEFPCSGSGQGIVDVTAFYGDFREATSILDIEQSIRADNYRLEQDTRR